MAAEDRRDIDHHHPRTATRGFECGRKPAGTGADDDRVGALG